MSNPADERPTPPAALNRLEVETASTTSLPISFPYLYITEGSNSFDTFNLLNRTSSNEGPKYPNTSHINAPASTEPTSNLVSSNKAATQPVQPSDDSLFNQVPKRFSQFILDQQNPYVSQRLDNLSAVSPSLGSDDPLAKTYKRTYSSSSKKTKISSHSRPSSSPYTPHSNTLSREISNSMGSQATIFSTRQEQEGLGLRSRSKKSRKSKINGPRFTRSKSSKVKAQLYAIDSSNSSLERRKAIKFKKGSILYRIKIRLERFLKKMKSLRFHNFKVSSKRPGQSRSNSVRRNKSLRTAKLGSGEKKPLIISAPSTNPHLGRGGVERVKELDDALKYLAGAPQENVNIGVPPQDTGKLNHLSSYIDQQQSDYVSSMRRKSEQSSVNYSKNNLLDPRRFDANRNEFIIPHRAESEAGASDTAESEAPPPPPHLVDKELAPIANNPAVQGDMVDLWRKYLTAVLCKRIQLRQEINMFQSFVASKAQDTFEGQDDIQSDVKDSLLQADIDVQSDYSSAGSPSVIYTTTDSEGTADIFVDPPAEEFNKTYLNRRSMLGDMLEYDSDGELDSSSVNTEATNELSITQSDLSVIKTYGTVSRRKPVRDRMESQSLTSSMSTIRRSVAHQYNLSALVR
ncbi:uncharacterized protein CANTADRAFT_87963 [Suhomyces tanzawaensis NRRL Y-17324]|uniref:Uncharacterized protein n=1 Tax=Suhomyces tanzawaensis NRRL Y-17324 TaxID=984487 RepID=A0A1E4SR87_9ASCO|nr:uncharacterized protein CANTADRAFT_87963 [Suhomyces tanzawaensis NRRL Y-17324]ODV82014.1 hypothetical protein CANTADRAFT_87963 [Suhomyces tanzawaensis NRRL Y-17324]